MVNYKALGVVAILVRLVVVVMAAAVVAAVAAVIMRKKVDWFPRSIRSAQSLQSVWCLVRSWPTYLPG
ncbi:hypothetical protein D3C87_2114500 [compost metagenome]